MFLPLSYGRVYYNELHIFQRIEPFFVVPLGVEPPKNENESYQDVESNQDVIDGLFGFNSDL